MASPFASFPPLGVTITTNSPDGTTSSFYEPTKPPPVEAMGDSQFSYIYSHPPTFSRDSDADIQHHIKASTKPELLFPAEGDSALGVLDVAPNPTGQEGPMHRTNTLDQIIILEGEMEFTLNNGEKRIFKKGDIVIQRGCWHSWKNTSKTEGARMLAFVTGGKGAAEGGVEMWKAEV